MQRDLKQLLEAADGESQFVVAIFLDVRGFSSFAKLAESAESALFLKSAYLKILDEYFPDAVFFKPTGDGLLLIRRFDASSLRAVVQDSVAKSIKLVNEFETICADDEMVNFDVPDRLGIGLARGAATALVSGEDIIDYTGRPLNLAARLMEIARPAGVVFDESLGYGLLEPDVADAFAEEKVYVKGIAEEIPVSAYVLKDVTKVPEFNRRPMTNHRLQTQKLKPVPLKDLMERRNFLHALTHEPASDRPVAVFVRYPAVTSSGRKHPSIFRTHEATGEIVRRAGEVSARIKYPPIAKALVAAGVKRTWEVAVTLEYPTVDDDDV